MEQQVIKIKQDLNFYQNKKKSHADKDGVRREFQVGDKVFLKVKGKKILLRLGNFKKLDTILCGPLEVLSRIRLVAYELTIPPMFKVHNVFHVSLLKKYVHDSNHILD